MKLAGSGAGVRLHHKTKLHHLKVKPLDSDENLTSAELLELSVERLPVGADAQHVRRNPKIENCQLANHPPITHLRFYTASEKHELLRRGLRRAWPPPGPT